MNTPHAQILISKSFLHQKKWQFFGGNAPEPEQCMHKMSLEHLVTFEGKEKLKERWEMSKGCGSQVKEDPTS